MAELSMEKLAKFLRKTRRLSYIERCSNTLHIQRYNVAEHSFYTAFLAMLFADLENERIFKDKTNHYYDLEQVIRKALIHDLEESITGDILYPIKNENSEFSSSIKQVIQKVVDVELFEELPVSISNLYKRLWKTSKDSTKEGQLVAAMDKLEILLFAETEIALGNTSFVDIYNKARHILMTDFNHIESIKFFC